MKLRYQMRGLGIGIIVTALLMGVASDNKIPLSDAEIKMRALELGMVESDSLKLSDIPKVAVGPSVEGMPLTPGADGTSAEGSGGAAEPGEQSGSMDAAGGESDAGNGSGAADGESGAGNGSGAAGGESGAGNGSGTADGEEAPEDESVATGSESNGGSEGGTASSENDVDGGGGRDSGNRGDDSDDSVAVVIESGSTSYSVCQLLEQLGLVEDASVFDEYLCGMGYSRSVREGTFHIAPGTSQEEIAEIITGKR